MTTGVYERTEWHRKRTSDTAHRGADHHNWKGDRPSYARIHKWLFETFGRPQECEMPGGCVYPRKNKAGKLVHQPKRYEWALKIGCKYERKRENFIQLCPSCHRKYDRNNDQRKGS